MANVSRPMLIALAATVALFVVWLVALRPKPVAVEKTPLASTKVVPAAEQAKAKADAANAKLEAARAADASKPAPAAGVKPATAKPQPATTAGSASEIPSGASKRERVILREIRQGKVVVMLFWSPEGAEDVATLLALADLNLRHGKVKAHVIPIGRVGQYANVLREITVAQSPTTLIIGDKGRVRTIVGLTESTELGQAVTDALAKR